MTKEEALSKIQSGSGIAWMIYEGLDDELKGDHDIVIAA